MTDGVRAEVHPGEHEAGDDQGVPHEARAGRRLRRRDHPADAPGHARDADGRAAGHGHRPSRRSHQATHRDTRAGLRSGQPPGGGPGGPRPQHQRADHGAEAGLRPGAGMALPSRRAFHGPADHGGGGEGMPGHAGRETDRRPAPDGEVQAGPHQVLWRAGSSVDAPRVRRGEEEVRRHRRDRAGDGPEGRPAGRGGHPAVRGCRGSGASSAGTDSRRGGPRRGTRHRGTVG